MKDKVIIETLHRHWRKIQKHFQKMKADPGMEQIHDFRLEVKKLRAFTRLLQTALPGGADMKLPESLRAVYESTGRIRNLQLHLAALQDLCSELDMALPRQYISTLSDLLTAEIHHFHKVHAHPDFEQMEETLLASVPAKLSRRSIHGFLIDEKLILFGHLLSPCADEVLHEIRKTLKDLMYNLECLAVELHTVFQGMFSDPESLKFITDRLGAFQDICIFLGFVHMHFNEAEQEQEQVLLQRIKTELGKRKEAMKKELWSFLEESRPELEAWKPSTPTLNL